MCYNGSERGNSRMDFDAALQHVLEQVRAAGIPASTQIDPQVRVNTRAKKRYGRCIFRDGRYEIELSARLQAADSSVVHTVLAHEVLHTCPGCMNHGARWKQYAAKMGERYGYSIQRTADYGLQPAQPPTEIRYLLRCTSCGVVFARQRMSKLVRFPGRYRCRCGGRLQRLR